MAHASLAELKAALRISDATDDTLLTLALDAATELVNAHCGRTFTASVVASTRLFNPSGRRVEVDDIYNTAGLIVNYGGTAIVAIVENVSPGYQLLPLNAPGLGEPYTAIDLGSTAAFGAFWYGQFKIRVTALWGYSAEIPKSVKQATVLQASRIFSRRQSPYGVAGSPEMGAELRLLAKVDPDVAVMLSSFVKMEVV